MAELSQADAIDSDGFIDDSNIVVYKDSQMLTYPKPHQWSQ